MGNGKGWVLVTGASSGIGRAVATELSSRYNLVLNGRDEARLAETAAQCCGSEAKLLPFDLASAGEIKSVLADFIDKESIRVAGFVHCAGVSRLMPIRAVTLTDVQDTLGTNLIAPFLITQTLAAKRINDSELKSVVFISSNISNRGARGYSLYGASKSGLDGLMRCLAVELAPAVRVNSVLPGAVRTRMTANIFSNEEVIERMKSQYPLGLGRVENIAQAVAFLLSDKSSWITGQQLTVDGGANINITG